MSYILEALKKSDQQRQRGVLPTLSAAAEVTVAAPSRSTGGYYSLVALVLLCGGIVIGWLRPWQAEQPVSPAEPSSSRMVTSISNQAAPVPLPAPAEVAKKTAQELPAQNLTPAAMQPILKVDSTQPNVANLAKSGVPSLNPSAPLPAQAKPAISPDAAQEQNIIKMSDLPLPIQQELPAMTVQLHSYSNKPINRLVSINSKMLHEGDSLTPSIKLEQITPDGVIFSYKGYHFQHGIW